MFVLLADAFQHRIGEIMDRPGADPLLGRGDIGRDERPEIRNQFVPARQNLARIAGCTGAAWQEAQPPAQKTCSPLTGSPGSIASRTVWLTFCGVVRIQKAAAPRTTTAPATYASFRTISSVPVWRFRRLRTALMAVIQHASLNARRRRSSTALCWKCFCAPNVSVRCARCQP